MKKISTLLLAILTLACLFPSCKKYEDGPSLSLRTKKARLAGEWGLSKMTIVETNVDNDGDQTVTTTETNGDGKVSITEVITPDGSASTSTTQNGTIGLKFTIEKDGTYSTETETSFTSTYTVLGITYTEVETTTSTEKGIWNFTGGIGDEKKKEQVVFKPSEKTSNTSSVVTSPGNPASSSNSTSTSTVDGEEYIYTIKLLKNKEMRLLKTDTNNSTSSNGTSSNSTSSTTVTDVSFVQ